MSANLLDSRIVNTPRTKRDAMKIKMDPQTKKPAKNFIKTKHKRDKPIAIKAIQSISHLTIIISLK